MRRLQEKLRGISLFGRDYRTPPVILFERVDRQPLVPPDFRFVHNQTEIAFKRPENHPVPAVAGDVYAMENEEIEIVFTGYIFPGQSIK
jgi:hypothetical protein